MMHFFRNTQQRDCPGVSPDSLFIRTPRTGALEQNRGKGRKFSEYLQSMPAKNTGRQEFPAGILQERTRHLQ